MLPKENRLSSDFDFKRVRKDGRGYHNPYFTLYYLEEPDQKPSRFGFIVSTKVSKSAAKRNRVKRIMRSEVEAGLGLMRKGKLVVFWVKPKAVEARTDEIRKSLSKALRDIRLI